MIDGSILIVGSGPSGLALASALAHQGVKARLVDSDKGPAETSRALGIQARTLEIFDLWSIGDEVAEAGLPLHGIRIYGEDKHLIIHVMFGDLPSRYPYMLSLPQSETEKILIRKVEEFGIEVERETNLVDVRFESESCVAVLENASGEREEARFQWLVGCDGAHSLIREVTHAGFSGKEYPQHFLLADVKIDWPLMPNEGHIFTAGEGILVCFPMPDGYYRIIATTPSGDPEPKVDLEEVRKLISARGLQDATVSDLRWSANFFVHARLVDSLQRGRTFLVGDAAHIHSPALGQGMNTGIQDAANLGWKLALVVKGLAGAELLDSYSAERWPVEEGVLKQTDFTTNVMAGDNRLVSWLRDHIAPLVFSNQKLSGQIKELVSELGVGYTDSPIVASAKGDWPHKAGQRATDATVRMGGADARLYELMRTNGGHHLIVLSDQPVEIQTEHLLGGEITVYQFRKQEDGSGAGVDSRGELEANYGWNCAYLLRPDGYIGAISGINELRETLNDYAKKVQAGSLVIRNGATLM